MVIASSTSLLSSSPLRKPRVTRAGRPTGLPVRASTVAITTTMPSSARVRRSRRTISLISPTDDPSTKTEPCSTGLPRRALPSAENSTGVPLSMMNTADGGTPICVASRPWATCMRISPCIGTKYFGLVSASIIFSSSCEAWPETCTCAME